jgi:hypothetical protein
MEWEKVFANHISDRELIPKYIRNLYNPTAGKLTKNEERSEHIKMVNRYMKRCLHH